jgi:lycopene cyclase domain-containing protein
MKKSIFQWVIIAAAIAVVSTLWYVDDIRQNYFVYDVPKVTKIDFFETHYLYWYIHIFSFIPVFCLSFDKRVHFYKKWKHLWKSTLIVGTIFLIWDAAKTSLGVWGFNTNYITGIFVGNLPIEECFFFITIPYACVFIYECLNYYFPKDIFLSFEKPLTYLLVFVFLGIGIYSWKITYSSTTYFIAGFYLLWHVLYIDNQKIRSRFYLAYLVSWIPFVFVDGVLTGGYQNEPIILYNPEEFLGFRVTSLPFEDSIYLIPLLLGNITFFEQSRSALSRQ